MCFVKGVIMFFLSLFILNLTFNTILWQEDFTNGPQTMSQLYDYTVDISYCDSDRVVLQANPGLEGLSSAWFYLDEPIFFDDTDTLELLLKVSNNKARIKYFYLKKDYPVYLGGEVIISPDSEWQTIKIPFNSAKPFYSSNFPFALIPHKLPPLYIFIDNMLPGKFDVEIDRMSVNNNSIKNSTKEKVK